MNRKTAEEKIVETARKLFWKFGFKKVTVEEICEAAKVSKMSFYRNFKNKTELSKRVLDEITKEGMVKADLILQDKEMTYAEKIEQIIHFKLEANKEISPAFIQDVLNNDDAELMAHIGQIRNRQLERNLKWFEEGQDSGDIRQDLNLNLLTYFSEQISKMATDPVLIQILGSTEKAIEEMTKMFFFGIMPRPNKKKENSK